MADNYVWKYRLFYKYTGRLYMATAAKHSSEKQENGKPKQIAEGFSRKTSPFRIYSNVFCFTAGKKRSFCVWLSWQELSLVSCSLSAKTKSTCSYIWKNETFTSDSLSVEKEFSNSATTSIEQRLWAKNQKYVCSLKELSQQNSWDLFVLFSFPLKSISFTLHKCFF